jgi:hypothetical protein
LLPNATYTAQIPKKPSRVDKKQREKARYEGGIFQLFLSQNANQKRFVEKPM